MRNTIFGLISLLIFSGSFFAQVSPDPVADAEVRDSSSIRMRSLELERVKREANKPSPIATSKLTEVNFGLIKDDFEHIQKLQSLIVKTYTTGKKINYEKIAESAIEMRKKAVRLGVNFFNIKEEIGVHQGTQDLVRKSVRDLIIELDNTLAAFVTSPTFTHLQVIDTKSSDKARTDLENIITLGGALQEAAENAGHLGIDRKHRP